MTLIRFSLLILCCAIIVIEPALTIIHGIDVQVWMPHNRPVVFMTTWYPRRVQHSTGNLIHRQFILTSGLALLEYDDRAQKTSVRIGSRQSFYGGVVRHVIRSQYINVTLGDMRMNFCIAMLDLAYEVGRGSGGSFAFLSVIYLRPLGHYAGITEKFMVSGWHGLNRHQLNHRMNAMQVKESNVFTCSQQYYNVEKYVAQQQPDSVGCFCPIECPWICSTDQSPGAVDMGAGVYKKNTNILIGLAQTTVARKTRRVNAIMSYTDRLALNSWMYSLADDEYEDYPEFDTWRGMF